MNWDGILFFVKQNIPLSEHIAFARRLTRVMDIQFHIFGFRFGIDPLLDVIPGLGNTLAAATSLYLLWLGYRLHVPSHIYFRMVWNISVDYIFGVIPFAGVVLDAFFRANVKNFALLERYVDPDILVGEVIG